MNDPEEDAPAPPGPSSESGQPEVSRIATFLRLRPVERPSARIQANADDGWVEFSVPRDASAGLINNTRESYRFPFAGVLPPDATQETVFDRVAAPVLAAALDGFNCTVFAFGQTGSGKTFTINGGTERYGDRGLVPRAISAAFAEAAQRSGHAVTFRVSYMEIYNEAGYDLLEPAREVTALEDLPRVHIMEDEGRMHIRNLSLHRCDTEEQALNMLFLGDTNRVVAETPLNQASSRSHCVFTLHIEARRGGEPLVRRSKLHFVDLAGSERAGKTGLAAHAQLREARYINLSLHYLEQVIVCLQEGRGHVPYRNSVLTQVLRDSLGGNTKTVMVAAMTPEAAHIEESISTCRFAQRVAMLSNRVERNEELDLEALVRQLKQENALLRQELQLLRSGGGGGGAAAPAGPEQRGALTEAEQRQLQRAVQAYVDDASPAAAPLNIEPSMLHIHAAFGLLRGLARGAAAAAGASGASGEAAAAELRALRQLAHQREQQIGVLAGVLRKQGLGPGAPQGSSGGVPAAESSRPASSGGSGDGGGGGGVRSAAAPPFTEDLLADQHKAFEYFCTTSPAHDAVAEHKAVLRGRYEEARALGAQVAAAKRRIGVLRSSVEQRRLARSMAALLRQQQGGGGGDGEDEQQAAEAEEQRAKAQIEQERGSYYRAYESLKGVKSDIDGMQAALQRARARLQADFQAWWAAMGGSSSGGGDAAGGAAAAAAGKQLQAAAVTAAEKEAPLPDAQQEWSIAAVGPRRPSSGASSRGGGGGDLRPAASSSFASWQVPQAAPSFHFGTAGGSSPVRTAGPALAPPAPQQQLQQPPTAAAPAGPPPQAASAAPAGPPPAAAAAEDPTAGVDADVLAAARPLLTGDPRADADIIRFYQARAALLKGLR